MDTVTYSSASTLCHCEMKYYWRYEQKLRTKTFDSESLWIGSAVHAGLEAYSKNANLNEAMLAIDEYSNRPTIGASQHLQQMERACKARAIVAAASERWPIKPQPENVVLESELHAEMVISGSIFNPYSGNKRRNFLFAGKIDWLVGGTLYDWKTSSDARRTIREKTISYQADLYAIILRRSVNVTVNEIVYRIIEVPSLQFVRNGEPTKRYAGDYSSYMSACYEWILSDASKMIEHHIMISEARLNDAMLWLWRIAGRVSHCRNYRNWLRNEYACHSWSRPCEYLPLCEAKTLGADYTDIVDQEYQFVDDAHPELAK